MNTLGRRLRLTTWGESHGSAIGGVLDGLPSGIAIDRDDIQRYLQRRAPGHNPLGTARHEPDQVEILSGVYQGKSTGAPISLLIRNRDTRGQDYEELQHTFRPGHADYTYHHKYHLRDPRGGGRSSARETAIRVAAGAIVQSWLESKGIRIFAWAEQIGKVTLPAGLYSEAELRSARSEPLGIPRGEHSERMQREIEDARAERDSVGGVVACHAVGLPVGLGEPIYDKLSARLASAMLSINATRGFEFGGGFALSAMRGSEANDPMYIDAEGASAFGSNHSGGTLGGISTGQAVEMRIAFKPTPTIGLPQQTISTEGKPLCLEARGRHDPCVIPRALPVVEAMCALTIGDFILLSYDHQ